MDSIQTSGWWLWFSRFKGLSNWATCLLCNFCQKTMTRKLLVSTTEETARIPQSIVTEHLANWWTVIGGVCPTQNTTHSHDKVAAYLPAPSLITYLFGSCICFKFKNSRSTLCKLWNWLSSNLVLHGTSGQHSLIMKGWLN